MVHDVVIIGSGFSGLGAAVRLRERGVRDVVILERADDLGGTWRDNRYPGCRCDVSSNLYSFSFAPNPDWSNSYSYQPEIWRYLDDVATSRSLRALIRFGQDVREVTFDAPSRVRGDYDRPRGVPCALRHRGDRRPRRAPAALARGTRRLRGDAPAHRPLERRSPWRAAASGIVGTGASAVQAIPHVADTAGSLAVFQRTPSWVLPHQRPPGSARARDGSTGRALAQRLARSFDYWSRELLVLGFVKQTRPTAPRRGDGPPAPRTPSPGPGTTRERSRPTTDWAASACS